VLVNHIRFCSVSRRFGPLPGAPPRRFKGQFRSRFNNFLGVSSLYVSSGDKPRRGSAPHPIDDRAAAGCALSEMIRLSVSADDRDQCQV